MSNELSLVEIKNPSLVFIPNGLDPLIERIEKEALSFDRDISTAKGRDNVRSLARKIAASKTALDKIGKDLGAEYRDKINLINAERSRAVDRLQALQDTIRAPLTAYEDTEKERVAGHEEAIGSMTALSTFEAFIVPTSDEVKARLQSLPFLYQREWHEFSDRATKEHERVQDSLNKLLSERKNHEDEQAELERLRAADEARKQKERDDKIAAEAAAKAKAEAESIAKAEAERQAKAAEEAQQKIIREKEAAEAKAKSDAEAAQKREADQAAALVKAEADKKAAAEKAEKDLIAAAEAAAKAERDRIAAEQANERKAVEARESNKKHKASINNDALQAIVKVMSEVDAGNRENAEECAKAIISAIAKGQIPHVKIQY